MTFPAANISLGGGELSPEVRARLDVSKVSTGASVLKNFFVRTSGGVSNRAGTEHVIHKRVDDPYGLLMRTIDFQFNVLQTYALMFTRRRIRIVKDGEVLFTSGAGKSITGITNANPAVVTAVGHGFSQDGEVYIESVGGTTEVNKKYYVIDLMLGAAQTITGATQANPVSVTVTAHGRTTGDRVYVENIAGMTNLNGRTFTITSTGANTFTLDDEDGTHHAAYVSGGTIKLADPDDFGLRGIDSTSYGAYTSGGVVKEIVDVITPYEDGALFDLYYTQSNDVMTLAHPDHPPANLKRHSEYDWRYEVINVTPSISPPATVSGTYSGTGTGRAYAYRVVAVSEASGESSVASAAATTTGDLTIAGDKSVVGYTLVSGATRYDIYRADDNSEFYGFIGSATGTTFTDRNIEPVYTDTLSLDIRDPFDGAGKYPSVVEYFQGRRWFANSDDYPTTVWGSKSGAFENFNVSQAVTDDDSITATISSKQANQIRHLVPLDRLLVLTSGSEWLLQSSGTTKLLTPSSAGFDAQGYWGAMKLRPIVSGSVALFVTGSEEMDPNSPNYTMIRDIQYTLQSDNYRGSELSVLAQHLFKNFELVDWAYAQFPYSIVWCVRNDGKVAALTYVAEHDMFAWSLHETDGLIESVCAVREGGEDVPYFVVKRKINGSWDRNLERMHTSQFTDVRDWYGVDGGVKHDEKIVIISATQANPVVVGFNSSITGIYSNGDIIEIQDVVGMTELNNNKYKIANITGTTAELQTVDGPVDIDGTAYSAYDEGGISRVAINTVTGLDHLEGKTVVALADGNVIKDLVVSSGQVSLGDYYSRVHCGLPYTSDFRTIDANIGDASGVLFNEVRKVDAVTLRFDETVGGQIGSDENNLYDIKWREDEVWGQAGALMSADLYQPVSSDYKRLSTVFYRQPNPLPVTILSVIPELSVGGDGGD